MMKKDKYKKWQLDNPNNARITVDYLNKEQPVKFDYVANDSIFKITLNSLLSLKLSSSLTIYVIIFLFTLNQIISITIMLIVFYPLSWLAAFIISHTKLVRIVPTLNTLGATLFYAEFKPENVIDNKVEIPLFKNVLLDYGAYEDFSKYLIKVEIIEHPFNILIKRKGTALKLRAQLTEIELKRNKYLWKATFYFSQKPEKGILKVRFK